MMAASTMRSELLSEAVTGGRRATLDSKLFGRIVSSPEPLIAVRLHPYAASVFL